MLIQHATLLDGRPVDIRVDSHVTEVADGLPSRPGEDVFNAAGGTVLPGLHDHHVHLYSAAAAEDSLQVGSPQVRDGQDLSRSLAGATAGSDGWIRGVGYHESVAGPLNRAILDNFAPAVPVRVQHRSGLEWVLNSAGLARIGLADHPDGRLRSADPSWSIGEPRRNISLAQISRRLMRYGVTAVTDATPDLDAADIVDLVASQRRGDVRQAVHFLSPGKRILRDDELNLDDLTDWIAARHRAGGPVAVHCVTAAQLLVAIAALDQAGTHPGDRIEHAAVVPDDAIAELSRLGITAVTQPNFVAERGDQYLADVPADEHRQLWRVKSLRNAGVPVALSTDMPFGCDDPWAAMRAAVHRATPSGAVLNADECVSARAALLMFLGHPQRPAQPREVAPGQTGDLCVLTLPPAAALAELDAGMVAATVIAGELV